MKIFNKAEQLFKTLADLPLDEKVETINKIRIELAKYSPFQNEPVDCVQWIKTSDVIANDYNPNTVAPPEMKLLELSILEDGYTQPIVTWIKGDTYEVVDGFHRSRVGRESDEINKRIQGYLPVVVANSSRTEKGDRIAATVRHNRARGKHRIDGMSDIVVELKRRNWSDTKIAKQLGMDADEVLRLTQITGLAEMFADREFSEAWEAETLQEADLVLEDAEALN
jgi:ParB-like chromosome segregation protein Spo0J